MIILRMINQSWLIIKIIKKWLIDWIIIDETNSVTVFISRLGVIILVFKVCDGLKHPLSIRIGSFLSWLNSPRFNTNRENITQFSQTEEFFSEHDKCYFNVIFLEFIIFNHRRIIEIVLKALKRFSRSKMYEIFVSELLV